MQARPHILVVDDESQITRVLRTTLSAQGYEIRVANDGETALEIVRDFAPDLVITDLAMPNMNGIELCRNLRRASQVPILVLSVRGEERSKVEALDSGADDYITKPFSTRELIARIRTAVRRVHAPARAEDAPIEIGEIRLNPSKRSVTRRGLAVHLTRKEYDILYTMMSRAGRVVSYAKLLTAVWGADCREEVEYLRTFIRQLRKKIEDDPSNPVYLLTDVYVGYRFADTQMLQAEPAEGAAEGREELSENAL